MSVQLRPQQSFTVVRQIANHTDNGTYYVQAVIRNASTDDLLATLNLDDKGSQRFKKNWQVPGDPSNQGFYVSIVTSVYTDSGYTTKSNNYGDEETTYLIANLNLGGGGGGGIDEYTLRKVIEDVLKDKLNKFIDFPEFPEPKEYTMRWDEVIAGIKDLNKDVKDTKATLSNSLKIQLEDGKIHFRSVRDMIKLVIKQIKDKEVTPETDLEIIKGWFSELSSSIKDRDVETSRSLMKSMVMLMNTFEKKEKAVTTANKMIQDKAKKDINIKNLAS